MGMNRAPRPRTPFEADLDREMGRVMCAVSRWIPTAAEPLPDTFFPAHLTVALIDAVFGARSGGAQELVTVRYCRHLGIGRSRPDRWTLPPVDAQDSLGALVDRYARLGVDAMAETVLRDGSPPDGRRIRRARCVLRFAQALRNHGVETLQDVQSRRPAELAAALRTDARLEGETVRRLLSYAGRDDFVWADGAVRGFVAMALGRATVSAARAAVLLRRAAWELILSPRALDYRIRSGRDGPRTRSR